MSVLDLLQHMTKYQTQLVEDSHLSQYALRDALKKGGPDAAKNLGCGDVMSNSMMRLILDWLPSMAD